MKWPQPGIIQGREDGKTESIQPVASWAGAVLPTQADGIDRAREILEKDGRELLVRGLNGQIHRQDTIPPGTGPRSGKGRG